MTEARQARGGGAPRERLLVLALVAAAAVGAGSFAASAPSRTGEAADTAEPLPVQPSAGGLDHDGDGVASVVDALPYLDTDTTDTDGDGYGDNQDSHPEDPARAVGVELVPNGGVDVDAAGWTAGNASGATHAPGEGHGGAGALRLAVTDDGSAVAWAHDVVALDPGAEVLHLEGAMRGAADVEARLHVRNRDPMGTSTVTRAVALVARGPADADGWQEYAVDVNLPSRPVSVRLELVASGAPGDAVLLDETSLTAQVGGDADGDGIDDRLDPDDDGDGYLDGEDPAPLDAEVGPVTVVAVPVR